MYVLSGRLLPVGLGWAGLKGGEQASCETKTKVSRNVAWQSKPVRRIGLSNKPPSAVKPLKGALPARCDIARTFLTTRNIAKTVGIARYRIKTKGEKATYLSATNTHLGKHSR